MSDTSANNKRIAKNTMMLYFRMLLTMGVSLYTSRVILNTLGVEDYGIYGVVGGVIWMFSFITNSMSGATQRFLTFELGKNNKVELQKVFNISIEIYIILSVIILVLAETIGLWFVVNKLTIPESRMTAAIWVYQASIVTAILSFITIPYNAVIIAHEKMSAFAYISIYEVVAKLGIVYLLDLFDFDKLKLYAILVLAIQVSIRVIYQIYANRFFEETKIKVVWDKSKFREMLGFAGWTLTGNISSVASTQGINIVMNMFFGPIVNAARAIASQVEGAVNGFVSNFQTALNPQIVKSYATNEIVHMHSLVFASCRYSFYLLFFLSLPICFEANTILKLWLGVVPNHTVAFLRITLLALLVNTQSNPLIVAAGATGSIKKYSLVVGTILLFNLPVVYICLLWGAPPEMALIVYLIFVFIAQASRLYMIRPMIQLSVIEYMRKVLKPIALVVVFAVIVPMLYKILTPDLMIHSIIICVLSLISSLISIYVFGVGKKEKAIITNKLTQIFRK